MSRLTKEQYDKLKEQYGVDRIWSWSRINTFAEQPWVYYMTYIHPDRVRTDNVYTYWGGMAHDLVQDMYDGKYEQSEMLERFRNKVLNWRVTQADVYKFMNDNVENGYINNLEHYFTHFDKINYKIKNELPVKIVLKDKKGKNIVFVGYIDSIYKDEDGNVYIMDYKTSSISGYSGKKLLDNSKQLLLYSLGIHQMTGTPLEKIIPRFDMMKYVYVEYLQKNGKWRGSNKERIKMVESQENRIRKALEELDYDIIEAEELIAKAIEENSFEVLPQEVQDMFRVKQAFVDVPYDESTIEELKEWIVEMIDDCLDREQRDPLEAFPQPRLEEGGNDFYFNVLAKQLLPYLDDYIERNAGDDLDTLDFDVLDDLFK